jgi:lysophospholipase L1-like esterase
MKRELFKKISLLLFVCIVCLLLLEIFFRILYGLPISEMGYNPNEDYDTQTKEYLDDVKTFFRSSENPILLYELVPHSTRVFSGVKMSINAYGMRDKAYSLQKPNDTFRIAVLGDSITQGNAIRYNETYATRLEEMLNADENIGYDVEVLNFGVIGYSFSQYIELYRTKVKQFEPDLVLVGQCVNDLEYYGSREMTVFRNATKSIFEKLYVLTYLRYVLFPPQYEQKLNHDTRYRQLKKEVGTVPVGIAVIPYLNRDSNSISQRIREHSLQAAKVNGFDSIDLFKVFSRTNYTGEEVSNKRVDGSVDYLHPNRIGHRLIADALYAYITSSFNRTIS